MLPALVDGGGRDRGYAEAEEPRYRLFSQHTVLNSYKKISSLHVRLIYNEMGDKGQVGE